MVDFTGGTWRSLIDGSEVSAIPDTVKYQLNALDLTGFADGDTVSQWQETITETDVAGGGSYQESSINGNAAVRIESNDEAYENQDLEDITTPLTAFAVVDNYTYTGDRNYITGDAFGGLGLEDSGVDKGFRVFGDETNHDIANTDGAKIFAVRYEADGGDIVVRVDGDETVFSGAGEDNNIPSLLLGLGVNSDEHLNGDAGILELHDVGLSDNDLVERENDIADMFDIDLS